MVSEGVEVKVPGKHHLKGQFIGRKVDDDPTGVWTDIKVDDKEGDSVAARGWR